MYRREPIKDRNYRTIGFIDINEETGDKTITTFSGKILGFYYKNYDRTEDFYHRIVGRGDQLVALLYAEGVD